MRQLWVQVPNGQGKQVINIAQAHQGVNLARFAVIDDQESQKLRDVPQHISTLEFNS